MKFVFYSKVLNSALYVEHFIIQMTAHRILAYFDLFEMIYAHFFAHISGTTWRKLAFKWSRVSALARFLRNPAKSPISMANWHRLGIYCPNHVLQLQTKKRWVTIRSFFSLSTRSPLSFWKNLGPITPTEERVHQVVSYFFGEKCDSSL